MKRELNKQELNAIICEKSSSALCEYIEQNMELFFATPEIFEYYILLKDIDIPILDSTFPILVKAWLAFLCGDHNCAFRITDKIDEMKLHGKYESSFYYSLKALMSLSLRQEEALKYAKKAIEILPYNDNSLMMANCKLTYGQALAYMNKFRDAADMFHDSYLEFKALKLYFPASVALVNYLLNKFKIGEFQKVVDDCRQVLSRTSDFKGEYQEYWNIVKLPLGMACFEMNKMNLAIQYLKEVNSIIDKMNLFHMHGLVELYLFKSYYVMNDQVGMKEVMQQAEANFKHMNYGSTDILISFFHCMTSGIQNNHNQQSDIERLELEFLGKGKNAHNIVKEILSYLQLKELSDVMTTEVIIDALADSRFSGNIPYVQLYLLILAEMNYINKQYKAASDCLKEAADIYKNDRIYANFLMYPYCSITLLSDINKELFEKLKKSQYVTIVNKSTVLSKREKEIVELMAKGRNNDEISKALFISLGTVKWHINHIFSKLEAANRIQAIEQAKKLGEL